jgi:altronate dehydratase small subunit
MDGEIFVVPAAVELGHKLARRPIAANDRVLKYGAPIGSMKAAVARGEHVHMHNLRSDYIPSTTREGSDGH